MDTQFDFQQNERLEDGEWTLTSGSLDLLSRSSTDVFHGQFWPQRMNFSYSNLRNVSAFSILNCERKFLTHPIVTETVLKS